MDKHHPLVQSARAWAATDPQPLDELPEPQRETPSVEEQIVTRAVLCLSAVFVISVLAAALPIIAAAAKSILSLWA